MLWSGVFSKLIVWTSPEGWDSYRSIYKNWENCGVFFPPLFFFWLALGIQESYAITLAGTDILESKFRENTLNIKNVQVQKKITKQTNKQEVKAQAKEKTKTLEITDYKNQMWDSPQAFFKMSEICSKT